MAELDQDHWWFLARRRILERLIGRVARPRAKARARVLEVGCGTGHNLAMLKKFGLLDVLEHVRDDAGSLRAIHRRLRPGGALLLTVPANPWMWSAHDSAHHHFRRYTRKQLKELFLRAGLEVQLLSYFNSLL